MTVPEGPVTLSALRLARTVSAASQACMHPDLSASVSVTSGLRPWSLSTADDRMNTCRPPVTLDHLAKDARSSRVRAGLSIGSVVDPTATAGNRQHQIEAR
jgi:hypothetical protein